LKAQPNPIILPFNGLNDDPDYPDFVNYPDSYPQKKYVYRLVFHIVRDANGQRVTGDVGEEQVMNVVRDLNVNYKQFNIFFKYKGFDYIDNSSLTGSFFGPDLIANFDPYYSNHAFHIFILDGDVLSYDLNSNIVHAPGIGFRFSTLAFLNYEALTTTRIPSHEIGHCLNLWHDFRNYGDEPNSEKVTRNSQHVGYNAEYAGDGVYDTPATRVWDYNGNNYNSQGYYIGSDYDYNYNLPLTEPMRYFKTMGVRFNNLMHVHQGPDLSLGYFLTTGQGRRIRWSLSVDAIQGYAIWSYAETTVEELYNPFYTGYVAGIEPFSVEDNGDGTANVCRIRIHRDRYQKGLNYEFEYVEVPNPNDEIQFDSSNPDQQKNIDMTYDYNVKVIDISQETTQRQTIVCTRGVICQNEPFVSGRVFSTQVLGSMNISVQELNEMQVKDPELFNSLLSHYYYILKKYTISGAVDESIFYKQ
jgi:hypothetical protein